MLLCKHIAAYPGRYLELFKAPHDGEKDTLREFVNVVKQLTGPKGIKFKSEDDRNKFKGDVLEVLAEIFFNLFGVDPAVGLLKYKPVGLAEDYGVDGEGYNANNDLSMVQVKFRGNHTDASTFPTYAEIARTFASGVIQRGLDPTKDHTLFVFTTADDVSHQCHTVFEKKLVVISYAVIQQAIDNNKSFWTLAYEEIKNYIGYHCESYTI
jgi:hypothetical protein